MKKKNTKLKKILESYIGKKLYICDKEKEDFINMLLSLAENNSEITFRTKGLNKINLLLKEDELLYEVNSFRERMAKNRGKTYWIVKKLNNETERTFKKSFTKYIPINNYDYAKSRKERLKRMFDITPTRYDEMLQEQNGCCAICGRHFNEFKKSLAVDHNHTSGAIRGLLCSRCNMMLGYAQDSPKILQNAIEYLK